MKAVIVDDENHCCETLSWQIEKFIPGLEVLQIFTEPRKALEYLKENGIDLLFLDIDMPGMDGFQLLKNLGERTFEVIFTTAYDQYAVEAFRANAADYLLKPIDDEALRETVKRIEGRRDNDHSNEKIDAILTLLNESDPSSEIVSFPTSDGYLFLPKKEIIFCESDSNYTRIYMVDEKPILISRTLKNVENMLGGKPFYRVHHSFLINILHVKKYVRSAGGYLVMSNGKTVNVSRSKKDDFLKHI